MRMMGMMMMMSSWKMMATAFMSVALRMKILAQHYPSAASARSSAAITIIWIYERKRITVILIFTLYSLLKFGRGET